MNGPQIGCGPRRGLLFLRCHTGAERRRACRLAIFPRQPAIGHAAEEDADEPAEVRHLMQGRDEANHQAHGNGRDQRANGFRVEAVAVPVFALWRVVEQIVNRHLAALNQNRADCGNHAPGAEADFLRRAVREIKRRGDEVRDDVDPDGGGDHRQQANRHGQIVAHAADGFDRVGDHAAKQRLGAGDNHHGDDGEQQEVKRQAPAVAAADLAHAFAVAGEVAKVEQRAGEVRYHQRGRGNHLPGLLARAQGFAGEGEGDPVKAGLVYNPACEGQHHHVDRRTGDINKALDGAHAVPEDHRLQYPHNGKADPAEMRQAQKRAGGERRERRPELQRHQHQGIGGQIGLNAVPREGNQPADHRRNIGSEHAKRLTADHRAEQHLPACQPERKEARGDNITPHAVYVRHPERKDVVPAPVLVTRRCQILIAKTWAVNRTGISGRTLLRVLTVWHETCSCE
ncbi:hypothetical protein L1887_45051 [Cichorium endivia]|nr:hypothetical protein L1887_45051 [Cichorium endivia]